MQVVLRNYRVPNRSGREICTELSEMIFRLLLSLAKLPSMRVLKWMKTMQVLTKLLLTMI